MVCKSRANLRVAQLLQVGGGAGTGYILGPRSTIYAAWGADYSFAGFIQSLASCLIILLSLYNSITLELIYPLILPLTPLLTLNSGAYRASLIHSLALALA